MDPRRSGCPRPRRPSPPARPSRPRLPSARAGVRRCSARSSPSARSCSSSASSALLFLRKLKVLTTSLSMLVSVAAYAVIWGWTFAVGFVALLFVHEMGHVRPDEARGRATSGCSSSRSSAPPSARARWAATRSPRRASASRARPRLARHRGAVPLAEAHGSDFLRALAFTGFFLNLFNLAPVVPLDGGRAMAAMAPWMWFAGFGGCSCFFVLFPNPILVLILLLGGMETWRRWKTRRRAWRATRPTTASSRPTAAPSPPSTSG